MARAFWIGKASTGLSRITTDRWTILFVCLQATADFIIKLS